MYFEWKDSYSVNIAEIDKQHKKLFKIGESICDLAMANDAYDHYDEIIEILQELKDYTAYHFNYEEKLMEKIGYENLETHKIEHNFIIKKLNKVESKDIDMSQKDTLIELLAFVSDWISGHILKTDMKYKDSANSKGIY